MADPPVAIQAGTYTHIACGRPASAHHTHIHTGAYLSHCGWCARTRRSMHACDVRRKQGDGGGSSKVRPLTSTHSEGTQAARNPKRRARRATPDGARV